MLIDNVLFIFIFNVFVKKKCDICLRVYVFNFNKNVVLISLLVDFDLEVLYMF